MLATSVAALPRSFPSQQKKTEAPVVPTRCRRGGARSAYLSTPHVGSPPLFEMQCLPLRETSQKVAAVRLPDRFENLNAGCKGESHSWSCVRSCVHSCFLAPAPRAPAPSTLLPSTHPALISQSGRQSEVFRLVSRLTASYVVSCRSGSTPYRLSKRPLERAIRMSEYAGAGPLEALPGRPRSLSTDRREAH